MNTKAMRFSCVRLVVALALGFSGCGGGGADSGGPTGPGPAPVPVTLTLSSEAARDGWAEYGDYGESSGAALGGTGDFIIGVHTRRQFFSFDLGVLPAGATIQSATLRLYQVRTSGTPYATHGVVVVDHMDYGMLEGSDFDLPPLVANAGTLSTDAVLEWKTLDVTALVQSDRAARSDRTQVRLRWSPSENDHDAIDDEAHFVDAEDITGSGFPPQLVLTYTTP
jgi:hypothetical protein